jgi:hypothetical protein
MGFPIVVRRVAPFVALLLMLAAIVAGCSSGPAPENAAASAEDIVTKCGPCQVLDCQTCDIGDGCPKPVIHCTCDPVGDGAACNDGSKCDLAGTCHSGACVSGGKVTCTPPDACHVATCNATTPCGTEGQDVCSAGTCVQPCGLMTCASQHVFCGQTGDGCGHIINCGTCAAPETCGGGGVPSTCGAPSCTKQTCAQIGASCGEQADGCGGLMSCGTCTAPQTCGGAGVRNQCGSGPVCPLKTCASYPAGTCGQQSDGCGGITPDCNPCPAPETCGGAGTLDACGYCGGNGFAPCSFGCRAGAVNDGKGHCVECSSLAASVSLKTTPQQPESPFWTAEFDYSVPFPSGASFQGTVYLYDTASGSYQKQAVSGLSGKATFAIPMLTTVTSTVSGQLGDSTDPACVLQANPITAQDTAKDALPNADNKCPAGPPALATNGGGPRGGPVTIVPLLWGYSNNLSFSQDLDAAYGVLEGSNYWAWLTREYGAPQITHLSPISVPNVDPTGSIETQLADWIRNNPGPSRGATMFVVHLKPGMTDTFGNTTLCVTTNPSVVAYNTQKYSFNALDGSFNYWYAVIPDPTTNCWGSPLGWDGMTVAMSHEIAENLTDPDGSTGWEARACGAQTQIGDLCAPSVPIGPNTTYAAAIEAPFNSSSLVVQKLWSNALKACVTEDAPGLPYN